MNILGLIGHPLGHTMSPFIHKRLFELQKRTGEYKLFDFPFEKFEATMVKLKKLSGYNITIPYKESVIPYLHKIDPFAQTVGAVNTVHNINGEGIGYNTDGIGFICALQRADIQLKGNVLLCGSGGVARVMAFSILEHGATLHIATRSNATENSNAKILKKSLLETYPDASVELIYYDDIIENYDLLCNATPAGMYPNVSVMPVTKNQLMQCSAVFDSVYNPKETCLLQTAKANGANICGGMPMLVMQAAAAHKIWFSASFTNEDLNALINDANREMELLFQ